MLLGLGWTARAFLINANSISNLRTHVCSPYVLRQPCYGLDCLTCCLSVFTDCVRQSYVDAPCLRKHSRLRLASVSPSHSFNAEERQTVESRDVQDDAEDISNENQQGQAKISRLKGLYIVATPIGNLEDITYRAVNVLGNVDCILAEDTRHSSKLLNYYNIKTKAFSFHEHNEATKIGMVIRRLSSGESVALISDAGTPLVSDPGKRLVKAAIEEGIRVIPIPGPSAVLTALSVSGLPAEKFTFCGFLPPKSNARLAILGGLKDDRATLIFFLPPHKTQAIFQDFVSVMGHERNCVVARELTKVHEEIWRGSLGEALKDFSERGAKGEFTLLVEGNSENPMELRDEEIEAMLANLISQGQPPSAAAKSVAADLKIPKNRVYEMAKQIRHEIQTSSVE